MAEEPATLNLRILSPSSEIEGAITLSGLPAATTVSQLRERIQDAVGSRPAPERMRLIYRGRVVANDADTLDKVFGAENIRESQDQSLHLVLRDLPPAASPSSSSASAPRAQILPPNPFRSAPGSSLPASPSLQTNPFRTLPQPRPASQPPPPPPHHHLAPGLVEPTPQSGHALRAQGQPSGGGLPASRNTAPPRLPPAAPQLAPTFPASGRTVQQEGAGLNGERWTVTFSPINNLPILPPHPLLPRPFAQPPVLGLPPRLAGSPVPNRLGGPLVISRLRAQLQEARQELDNARTLSQSPSAPEAQTGASSSSGPPAWRNGRLLHHLQNSERLLGSVEQGLALSIFDPTMAHHPDVLALRQSFNQLRNEVEVFSRTAGRERSGTALESSSANQPSLSGSLDASASAMPLSGSLQPPAQAATSAMPSNTSPELFILSSPQGPVGVLFNQQGTFTTAPIVPTMTYQSFTDQFNRNRQLIAELGQQVASSSNQAHNHSTNLHPTPTQQPTTEGNAVQLNQIRVVNQNQNENQNQNQNQNANQLADGQADVQGLNIATHLWLLFKLVCFVYIFSGGGGWYRPIMLGTIAAIVYLVQLGIFEDHFNVARRHFEALLPVGAFAERIVQRRPNAPVQRNEPIRNLTPQEVAQRLLQQQRDQRFSWVRESLLGVQRALALFLASLLPGFGERIVRAEEDRARADRAAEEERVRLEEETRAREAEAKKSESEEKKEETHEEGEAGEASLSAKGKERAVVAEEDEA